jgi:hypothetical protein
MSVYGATNAHATNAHATTVHATIAHAATTTFNAYLLHGHAYYVYSDKVYVLTINGAEREFTKNAFRKYYPQTAAHIGVV